MDTKARKALIADYVWGAVELLITFLVFLLYLLHIVLGI